MKLFTTSQIAGIDRYTIEHEPVSDIDLMERAASEMYDHLINRLMYPEPLVFFAGPGNNGGDALAMARMLAQTGFPCSVYLLDTGKPMQGSPAVNLQRLDSQGKAKIFKISSAGDFPALVSGSVVIDGLFGSGLTRRLDGLTASLVRHINAQNARVYAIDLPSGLMGEDNTNNSTGSIIRATCTLTLQFPKISLLFPENGAIAGSVEVIGIGLHPEAIASTPTSFFLTEAADIRRMMPVRQRFSHKGHYGHALLIAGSYGKMGAAILAARGCLRAGAGLLTAHIPREGYAIMQTAIPEVMCSVDDCPDVFSSQPDTGKFNVLGIGPGLGKSPKTLEALRKLLTGNRLPVVADADALNLIAENPDLLKILPPGTVMTPHPVEFERLFGKTENSWQRLQLQTAMARKHNAVIVLKGAYTAIATPSGEVHFNPTGNPGMATAGSGDVLTGIILGLMAQGLTPEKAAIAGVYLHGSAGDLAARKLSQHALIASDITEYLGKAIRTIFDTPQQEF